MGTYYMNEGALDLPAKVVDRTTHLIEMNEDGRDLTLVVCRGPLPEGKTLREAARGRVKEEDSRLTGYSVLDETETTWGGEVPALETSSRWRHGGRAIYQRQAHMLVGSVWFYLALSTPMDSRATADRRFETIRETIRLRT